MNDTTVALTRSTPDAIPTQVRPYRHDHDIQEKHTMLFDEELTRSRMREHRHRAAQSRLANQVVSARRWDRLAAWTARRALRAHDKL